MKHTVSLAALAFALIPAASAQLSGGPVPAIVLHGGTYGSGASLPTDNAIADLGAARFNDQISSVTVNAGRWELCEHGNFGGRCEVVDASVQDLSSIGLNDQVSSLRPASARGGGTIGIPSTGDAAIIFYSSERFGGEAMPLTGSERDFNRLRFNDRARSVDVRAGVWRVCTDGNFRGRCEYVDQSVRSLADIGLSGQVSSAELTPYDRGPQRSAIALFADGDFYGPFLGFDDDVPDLSRYNFNDTASSILINSGRWLVCADRDYRGTCEVLDASTRDLNTIALNDRITSLRRYDGRGGGRDDRDDRDYPRDDDRYGGGYNDRDGVRGEETVFFARPLDNRGQRIRNADGQATRFCRDKGFSEAVYKGNGRYLGDVLCR